MARDGVKTHIRGKSQWFKVLRGLAPAAAKELLEVNRISAEAMAGYARESVAIGRTGNLRDSIVVTPPGGVPPQYAQGATAKAVGPGSYMVTAGNTNVRYAHLVEFGAAPHVQPIRLGGGTHPGAPAQPFFWPSYRRMRRQHRAKARKALGLSIQRAKRQRGAAVQ